MYTQCPECLTIYEIDEDALQESLGIVHCGRCGKRFDALRTLSNALPEAPMTPLPAQDPEWHAPTLTEAVPPSAYELAARKRRLQPGAGASEQHELDLDATTPAAPDGTDEPPRVDADDWFADMESQLAVVPAGATPEPSTPEADDAESWKAEPADDTAMVATDADPVDAGPWGVDATRTDGDAMPLQAITDDVGNTIGTEVEAAPDARVVVPLATMSPERATGMRVPDIMPGTDVAAEAPDAARVASPLPTDGDVFGAEGEDAPVPAEPPGADSVTESPEPVATVEPMPVAEPEAASAPAHVYIPPHRRRASATGMALGIGCVVLALALAVQLAWAGRVELVRNPATRAWAERACRSIPCRLPPIKDTARLELLSRDVRPDPNAVDALTITATMRNDAAFRQPWPVVVVELTDFDNHPVAMRRFRPAEYMPDPARRAAGIAPGATAALAFEVADPGKDAGGFRFGFE